MLESSSEVVDFDEVAMLFGDFKVQRAPKVEQF